ncbi:MAG: cytochrome C oxidase subunit IV family protein [Anaerolineales bacterium]|jgi:caa(3)-type oxidase subunit IV
MEANSKPATSIRTYAGVYAVLGLITLIEILLADSQGGMSRQVLTPAFLMFSLAKASLVAAFFMHLRNDSKFYTAVFLLPAVLLLIFALLATVR